MATALVPALLLSLTACQSSTAGPEPAPRTNGKAAAAVPAGVGDTADVGGSRFGEHLRISLRGFVDPAVPTKAARRPAAGHRWVGVNLRLVNVGGAAYEAPLTKAWIVDEHGRKHPAVTSGEVTTGFPLSGKSLQVGDDSEGWLAFEVPYGSRAVRLHCTVGSQERNWQL
ncbi:DUF4352 domain-containing protein [Streptomyces sp. NPDC006283]|uniref:DUF4352 domain-containing protein n=1 Tax=Streptomyces sp. NPDC006283 TaxID=3156741 RepID=UPI0033B72B1B